MLQRTAQVIIKKGEKISKEKKLPGDNSGQSKVRQTGTFLENGDLVLINCFKYGKKYKKKHKTEDHMRVSLFTSDYNYWLNNIAYK